MKKEIYSDAEVLEALTEVVAEYGDSYVYPETLCRYVVDDQPSCLVGKVLATLGWTVEELNTLHNRAWPETSAVLRFGPGAVDALTATQAMQDCRRPWGECLVRAKEILQ